ncbi:MAG: response regulator [Gammaproteobacteria bacterium]|nr:response regulator [Gammaproteobacteria bacterium]MBT3489848.1 response regulator [Gammaproteobacteria bacterium]MBT3718672.1 response regulator [Gammaproteobacteria bacterium]MBT3844744.1 response regulator [Gammaproteobacteria bacterium]MBT3893856.1 response regulator [Gammaproteobacteria bacterium]
MKQKITLLLVDDEENLREMVSAYLQQQDIVVSEVADATAAWNQLSSDRPDIVLLDWMLPDMDGIQLLQKIRAKKRLRRVPVIMLTARADEQSRVSGLDAGADDYIVKPFSLKELVARIRAVLRRLPLQSGKESEILTDEIKLDLERYKVFLKGKRAHVSPTEFRLLHFLMSHPNKVYSRSQLLNHVWGEMVMVEERTVDQHVRRLRKVLKQHGCSEKVVTTVRGFGYQFIP